MPAKKKLPHRLRPAIALNTVEVKPSDIHGLGAFAKEGLRSGALVGTYVGKRYAPRSEPPSWDGGMTYLFLLSDGSLIDGAHGGNATRHINHCCNPNVEAVERRDETGQLVIQIVAKRRIKAGSELFLDYSLEVAREDEGDYVCRCGHARCRGSMVAPQAARERAAAPAHPG